MSTDGDFAPTGARVAATLAIGAAGGLLFAWLRLPLPWMVGAMMATTICAAAGAPMAIEPRMRTVMITVLGVMLGSVFTPEVASRFSEWAASIGVLTGYVICATGVAYLYCRRVAGYDRATAYFAAAPGGLSEMVLSAPQYGGDGRRVALTHAARVMLVVLALPNLLRIWLDDLGPYGDEAAPILPDWTAWPEAGEVMLLLACAVVGPFAARAVRLPTAALTGR